MTKHFKDLYYSIVNYRKNNPLSKDQYGENHHIKPRSLYPDLEKDPDNIVRLTAGEHYKCHYYLVKMYEAEGNDVAYRKMLFAFNQMSRLFNGKHVSEDEIGELSQLYGELRERFRNLQKGEPKSEETREKMSNAKLGKVTWNRGKKMSEEYRKNVSKNHADVSGKNNPNYGNHKMQGRKWFNNGLVCIRALECPEGFVPGRIKQQSN